MTSHTVTLLKKEKVARDTMAFHFKKPADFHYHAGQYIEVTITHMDATDKKGNSRNFSLASTPFEDTLVIVTRLRDTAFKHALRELSVGTEVLISGPYGSFALPKDASTPAVFICGGIGATFARSVITQAAHDQSNHTLLLLYSTRTKEDAIYMDTFTALSQQHKNIRFVPTLTENQTNNWTGERSHISMEMLKRCISDIHVPIYYLSGSAAMVVTMRKMLVDAGVNKFNIRFDQFIGY